MEGSRDVSCTQIEARQAEAQAAKQRVKRCLQRSQLRRLRKEAGRWLRELREKRGLSQRELADKVGAEIYTLIAQLEHGRGRIPPDRYPSVGRRLGDRAP